jgi:cytochrome P450
MRSPLLSSLRTQTSNDLLEATFRETGRLYTNLTLVRRVITPQQLMGHFFPSDTFVACSPLVTARDPNLFPDADEFLPERWLTEKAELDEMRIKAVHRSGLSNQFGKGQHACKGEELGRMMVRLYWKLILGDDSHPGFDVEIVSGVNDGVGISNVGVAPAWTEENLGTPFQRGKPVMVRFNKRNA